MASGDSNDDQHLPDRRTRRLFIEIEFLAAQLEKAARAQITIEQKLAEVDGQLVEALKDNRNSAAEVREMNDHARHLRFDLSKRDRNEERLEAQLVESRAKSDELLAKHVAEKARVDCLTAKLAAATAPQGQRKSLRAEVEKAEADLELVKAILPAKREALNAARETLQSIRDLPAPEIDPPTDAPSDDSEPNLAMPEISTSTQDSLVGIVGGADGPTATFLADPTETVTFAARPKAVPAPGSEGDLHRDWIVFCDCETSLSPSEEAELAQAIAEVPADSFAVYSDTTLSDGAIWRKPQFDPELAVSRNLLGPILLVRHAAAETRGWTPTTDPAEVATALLIESLSNSGTCQPFRIPVVAGEWTRESETRWLKTSESALKELADSPLNGEKLAIASDPLLNLQTTYPLPATAPTVAVVIPSRDHADLLSQCVNGLLSATDYPGLIDITIVDNGSTDPTALELLNQYELGDDPVCVIRSPGPFNFSKLCNVGVAASEGELVCLVNNDIEIIQPGWLTAMAREAIRPDVGAVGAKLLYPDRTVQHAGMVLGIGDGGACEHVMVGIAESDPGYAGYNLLRRTCSAMTAACLMVRRDHWETLNGFDEVETPITCNDVDLCLRLRDLGLRNLWIPDAVLVHHESASRDAASTYTERLLARIEAEHILETWPDLVADDPCYSPALSRTGPFFTECGTQPENRTPSL